MVVNQPKFVLSKVRNKITQPRSQGRSLYQNSAGNVGIHSSLASVTTLRSVSLISNPDEFDSDHLSANFEEKNAKLTSCKEIRTRSQRWLNQQQQSLREVTSSIIMFKRSSSTPKYVNVAAVSSEQSMPRQSSSNTVSLLEPGPGEWTSTGAQLAVSAWILNLSESRKQFRDGVSVCFRRHLFWGVRKLSKLLNALADTLERLRQDLENMPCGILTWFKNIDTCIRSCLDEIVQINDAMLELGPSETGPLRSMIRSLQKQKIKDDLGPQMEHLMGRLQVIEDEVKLLSEKMRSGRIAVSKSEPEEVSDTISSRYIID